MIAKRQKSGEQNTLRYLIVLETGFEGGRVLIKRITIKQKTEIPTVPTRLGKSEVVVPCGALQHLGLGDQGN